MEELVSISGIIEEVIYTNPENGYTVCDVAAHDGQLVTAVGCMPYVTEGESVVMTGMWDTHPNYGEQFRVSYCETVPPSDEDEILKYLSSGIISGVREATAKKLVEHFGTDVFSVMLTNPEKLAEIKGISDDKAKKIGDSYSQLQAMRSIVMFLQRYGVNANIAVKVHNILGSGAVKEIEKNPYILADRVDGITFKTSDTIAFNMGLPKNSPMRLRAGIKYTLQSAAYSDGHTYLPRELLTEHAAYELGVDESEVENALSELVFDKEIYADTVDRMPVYYLYQFFEAEYYISRRLCSLADSEQKYTMTADEAMKAIDGYEKEHGLTLAAEQRGAVVTALSEGCMILTGGPGTGKTTVIRAILELLRSLRLSAALAAPTGRAAKRLSQVTGREAKTLHRLLGTQRAENGNFHSFAHNEQHPLSEDVIIVDEVSMIDVSLMSAFLRAVKRGARVIFSGDADQLPSVGPGNVLRDIIDSGVIPVIELNKIFRQAEESLIIVNAHRVNKGEMPDLRVRSSDFFFLKRGSADNCAYTVADLYMNRLPKSYGVDPITAIQVLSPTKKGAAGTVNLNRLIQMQVNPPSPEHAEHIYGKTVFREGDKIMQIKNNYEMEYKSASGETGTGIFNGDMGVICEINQEEKYMLIVFDEDKTVEYPFSFLDELDLAYAVTVHKSQGSEFPIVVMPVCSFTPQLTSRNLFYTAITRAKDMVVLVGSERVIVNMVANDRRGGRYTGLRERLETMNEILGLNRKGESEAEGDKI